MEGLFEAQRSAIAGHLRMRGEVGISGVLAAAIVLERGAQRSRSTMCP